MPIIYILTNESMPDTIKVGKTDNLERRIKELDKTNIPLPFECYYALEVLKAGQASEIEKNLHQALGGYRIRKNREFFATPPERAKSALKIAETLGGKDVTPGRDIVNDPEDQQALDSARKRRSSFKFSMLRPKVNIAPGTVLHFRGDKSKTCEVVDDTQVEYREQVMSLTSAAKLTLQDMGKDWQVSGPNYWCIDGKSLYEIRKEIDEESGEKDEGELP